MAEPIDLQADLEALNRAISTIERLYPGYKVFLMPTGDDRFPTATNTAKALGPEKELRPIQINPPRRTTNKDAVFACLARGWKTKDQIMEETKLTPNQIYGVLTAPADKDKIERRELNGGPAKEFRLKKEE